MYPEDALERALLEAPFPRENLLCLGQMGSVSHGTHGEIIDDWDFMGVFVPPVRAMLGLEKLDHWVHGPDEDGIDIVCYSLAKFGKLVLKSNPNVLGLLWLNEEHYILRAPHFEDFIENRGKFVSQKCYHSFIGYADSQLKKMHGSKYAGYMGEKRKALVDEHGYDTKNAAHLIRLLRMGRELLRTGYLRVDRSGIDADELRKIKKGGSYSLEHITRHAENLFRETKEALAVTTLPSEPNRDLMFELIIECYRDYICNEYIFPNEERTDNDYF